MAITNPWAGFFDGSTYYTGPALTDAMVSAAERLVGYKLPESYLRLLRVKNGGVPKRQCHPTSGTHWSDNHVQVNVLFGIGGEWGIDSEQHSSPHMIQEGGFPEIGIIVGWTTAGGHDAIMLDYTESGPQGDPRVAYVDGESGESELLAPNFEAFLKGLVDCRPYEEQTRQAMDEFRRRTQQSQ